jgi:hypothetical protein
MAHLLFVVPAAPVGEQKVAELAVEVLSAV